MERGITTVPTIKMLVLIVGVSNTVIWYVVVLMKVLTYGQGELYLMPELFCRLCICKTMVTGFLANDYQK